MSVYRSTFNQDSRNTSQFSPSLNGRNDDTLNLTSASVFGEIGLLVADRRTVTRGVRIGHDSVRRGYALVNARIGWQNDRLKAYLFSRNLIDRRVEVVGACPMVPASRR
jgi:outer membrane receptor protein involved in Fe transport